MEAVLRAFEEYSAQLAEVQEGLRLDPENGALKELLVEIASNIERTEAELALGDTQGAGNVIEGDAVVDEEDLDLYGEDDEEAEEESSSDEEGAAARPSEEEPHYSRASIALLAQGWRPQSEAEEPQPDASVHWRVTVPAAAAAAGAFGEWERFTRGVGSRLLARMGYRRGGGLGARGDGTVEPLGAGTAPRGTHGLGYERRPKRRRGGKRGRAARQAASEAARKSRRRGEEVPAASTFDFLNRTLNRTVVAATQGAAGSSGAGATALHTQSESELRRHVVAEQERKLALERKAAQLRASLERNKKDAALAGLIRAQLAAVTAHSAQAEQRQASAGTRLREEEERKRGFKF